MHGLTCLHHTPCTRRRENTTSKRYLDGPYLLDPLYHLALKKQRSRHWCRFREESPGPFSFE